MWRIPTFALAALLLYAAPGQAQQCTPDDPLCNQMLEASEVLQARAGIGLAGGNPVPGATSTLGMRIGSVPRMTVAARVTGVGLDMPGLRSSEADFQSLGYSVNADAAVGVFSGFSVAPTVGGLLSLDAVASVGMLRLPGSHGLDRNPGSWAVGARVGVLRESFTAPGISVTAMYRRIGKMAGVGDDAINSGSRPGFTLENNSVLSLRAVVGKRLFVVGANAGVGYDSYRSDVNAYGIDYRPVAGDFSSFGQDGRKLGRVSTFVNATWTMLIVNFVAEAGWQRGGDRFTATLPSGQSSKTQKNGYFGSLAVRLAL
ncbi:MAG TPA: hypothetical protein VF021_06875 [Longimicrobiales bacterium]